MPTSSQAVVLSAAARQGSLLSLVHREKGASKQESRRADCAQDCAREGPKRPREPTPAYAKCARSLKSRGRREVPKSRASANSAILASCVTGRPNNDAPGQDKPKAGHHASPPPADATLVTARLTVPEAEAARLLAELAAACVRTPRSQPFLIASSPLKGEAIR